MTASRRKRPLLSVQELHERHAVERAHTMHVVGLALKMFDLTRVAMGLDREHRRILEAAAMLHDVAFSIHPAGHADAGARLLLREGIAGFSATERAVICAVILLHSVRYKNKLDGPLVRDVGNRDLILKLAAYLRIADGLDCEHIQNATLLAVDTTRQAIVVSVKCCGRERVVVQAHRKADLWREVFDRDIIFVPVDASRLADSAIVSAGDAVPEAARRLMYVQYKTMRDAEERLVRCDPAGALHDLRVAIRRLRALLKLFGRYLNLQSSADLERDLGAVSLTLGPGRDLDVWIEQWESVARKAVFNGRAIGRYGASLRRQRLKLMVTVGQTVRSRAYIRLCLRLSAFIRTELERAADRNPMESLSRLARNQFDRAIQRIESREGASLNHSSEALHAYRKAVRRARYVAEFLSPVLSPWGRKAARVFEEMATELGLIRDIDSGVSRLAQEFPSCPDGCVLRLAARRDKAVSRFKEYRRSCRRKRWYRNAKRRLSGAERAADLLAHKSASCHRAIQQAKGQVERQDR